MMKLFNFGNTGNLDEVIFKDRNKTYGAYMLRNEESNFLKKAMIFGVSAFVTIAAVPFLLSAFQPQTDAPTGVIIELKTIVMNDVVIKEEKKPEIIKTEKSKPDNFKTVNTQLPTPSKKTTVEKTVAKKSDTESVVLGFDDKKGIDKPDDLFVPKVKTPDGPIISDPKPFVPKVDNEVKLKADKAAVFPGGMDAFRNQVGKYFNQQQFDGTGELMRADLTFVVEKNGTISNIKVSGTDAYFNKEAIKTLNQIKTTWKPAQINGENVRFAFKIPIVMQFD